MRHAFAPASRGSRLRRLDRSVEQTRAVLPQLPPRARRVAEPAQAERRVSPVVVALLVAFLLVVGAGSARIALDGSAPPAAAAVEMPDVRTVSFGDAVNRLAQSGLAVERIDVIYGPGPLNQVVDQQPAPGEQLDPGDSVTLVVRTGR